MAGDPERSERLPAAVIAALEQRGIALISNASLRDGRMALRACIVNFRTSAEDIEAFVAASCDLGEELAALV